MHKQGPDTLIDTKLQKCNRRSRTTLCYRFLLCVGSAAAATTSSSCESSTSITPGIDLSGVV